MNHYCYFYLSHHPEIKKALFCFDKITTTTFIGDFIKNSSLEEVAVFTRTTKEAIDFSIHKIGDTKVKSLDKEQLSAFVSKDCYVFCIDLLDEEMIESIQKTKPNHIIFDYNWNGPVDSEKLWTMFSPNAKEFKLAQAKNDICYKIFDWEKREDSDIELSVIFPMYNVAKYLPELIKNITAWKAPYVEFLFVNDGSPDNSAQIIEEHMKKDPRIKLLNKENGGCASAREFGLAHANGRYVCLIDPDDFTDETMLEKLLFKAMSGTYDIAYCGYNEYYNDTGISKPVEDMLYCPYEYGTEDKNAIQALIPYLRVGIWRMIFRREMLSKHNIHFYTDLRRFDDLPFKVETLLHAESVISIPEHLYYYRLEREGQDVAANDERLYVHFDIFKHLDEDFKSVPAGKLMDYYHVVKIQTHSWALTKLKPELKNEYMSKAKKDLLTFYNKKQLHSAMKAYCPDRAKVLKEILSAK